MPIVRSKVILKKLPKIVRSHPDYGRLFKLYRLNYLSSLTVVEGHYYATTSYAIIIQQHHINANGQTSIKEWMRSKNQDNFINQMVEYLQSLSTNKRYLSLVWEFWKPKSKDKSTSLSVQMELSDISYFLNLILHHQFSLPKAIYNLDDIKNNKIYVMTTLHYFDIIKTSINHPFSFLRDRHPTPLFSADWEVFLLHTPPCLIYHIVLSTSLVFE